MKTPDAVVDHYGAQYGNFASRLYAEIRVATFGTDIGQNGWLTVEEQDHFLGLLGLSPRSRLLDVACGSGSTTLRIARLTGCRIQGIDIHEKGIGEARERSEAQGLTERATFDRIDANQPLPFPDGSFDCVVCIDAINHLRDRGSVLREWARVLAPGGQVLFTDPIVVTGPLTNEEIAIRSSIGFFLFVPRGTDEQMLSEAGFEVREVLDRTENMARIAAQWGAARRERERELREVEGDATYEGQQRFFAVASRLAEERRLSRIAFHAVRR